MKPKYVRYAIQTMINGDVRELTVPFPFVKKYSYMSTLFITMIESRPAQDWWLVGITDDNYQSNIEFHDSGRNYYTSEIPCDNLIEFENFVSNVEGF